ncbi:DNA-protecting protein DprA [Candidatus Falkowbacteria bacterium CG11_big_fil_rev_8_21_14_0_20_39_10]|uniref:DNA-protecting protein DprA n=1 Tax=Candidatus Falkowbacteria bacterium CG11_big_fil_rev_8_21_14_0_20_39_10 TaxID=1974570 RepID=A0A2M6K8K0_9BACT|nr:MAG: DNA-protecting protein DprA [Candidatus Falkowbacteria bacterium CG11_big_fil_rev_8_21_14_0_20_39_10]
MRDLKYWIGLNHFPKFGPSRFKRLQKYFENLELAFTAGSKELTKAGIEEAVAEEFLAARDAINIEKILQNLAQENIKVMIIDDKNYPALLKEIYNYPPLLYYKGELDLNNDFCLAVVGTRKYTPYGQQITGQIVRDLTNNNLAIISGLALGIDTLAHLACLEAGGKTAAVLGSGLDRQSLYPSQNRYLVDKIIAEGGAVISEFPPGTQPLRHNFPQRNRIISGLSLGTLVVEAGEKSGALITANYSLEQNREVFAVPGNIYSESSRGPNKLIKMGAKVVTGAEDIIETLDLSQATAFIETKKIIGDTKEEKVIIPHLSQEPIHINELIRLTKLDTNVINSTLTIMEMKGMVKNLGGMQYVLAR